MFNYYINEKITKELKEEEKRKEKQKLDEIKRKSKNMFILLFKFIKKKCKN